MAEVPAGFPLSKEEQARPWRCPKENPACTRTKPCRSCLGRRNRRSGMRKQRTARKGLGIKVQFSGQGGNEETWNGAVRVEVKSGAQAGPVWTRYKAAEDQSEANKSIGDSRPFVAVFMPSGMTDGLVVCRLSRLPAVLEALTTYQLRLEETVEVGDVL